MVTTELSFILDAGVWSVSNRQDAIASSSEAEGQVGILLGHFFLLYARHKEPETRKGRS